MIYGILCDTAGSGPVDCSCIHFPSLYLKRYVHLVCGVVHVFSKFNQRKEESFTGHRKPLMLYTSCVVKP